MRLRADFWVAAYLRRCAQECASAVLRRRGAPEAGAIFVKIDRLDGSAALFGPAPQCGLKDGQDRLFARLHRDPWIDPAEAEHKLGRQINFDPDVWIVETEDRQGRCFLDVIAWSGVDGLRKYTARHGSPRRKWALLPRKKRRSWLEAHRARAKKAH